MAEELTHPALSQIKTERDDVIAFEVDGHLGKEETDRVYDLLEEAYSRHDSVNLLVRMGRYDGFDWAALFSEKTYFGKLHALKHLRRYAVVGGPNWFGSAIGFFNPLFRVDVRHFEFDDEAAAWNWMYEDDRETAAT